MPMYEYACGACGHEDTLLEKLTASRAKKCPACGKARAFRRQVSAPSFQLKGTGWYVTDFRDGGKKLAKKADAKTDGEDRKDAKQPAKADDAKQGKPKESAGAAKDKPAPAAGQ